MKDLQNKNIEALRAGMASAGIAAAIIPQADPHMGEYLADHWQVRRWLSGFTGSAWFRGASTRTGPWRRWMGKRWRNTGRTGSGCAFPCI